jgi:O-antigen ligase
MVRAHPWAGVGAGGFNDAYREYTSEWRFRVSRGHAHSGYLQMGAQAGIAGAVTFAAWIGSILLRLIERWRAGRPSTADGRVVGGLATVVAFTVHSVVDFLNVLSLGIQFALVIAIALASISPETEPVDEGMDSF